MTLMAEKANNHCPGCNGWWVIFHKHTTFGRFFFLSWKERCQGRWKSKLTQRRIAGNSGRKKSLQEMDQNVVRPVMPQVKTCLSEALDQSSQGFWYFEHLNLAYRAAEVQSSTLLDGFYHTFCSTSILSTFLFIGPYGSPVLPVMSRS